MPASYFPSTVAYILFTSPASFDKAGHDWRAWPLAARRHRAFRIAQVKPRQSVKLARWDGYWERATKANVDSGAACADPGSEHAPAALRSGQVDWIEVPPPDGITSLKAAGSPSRPIPIARLAGFYNIGAQQSVQGCARAAGR